jgi:hypothetical protein
MIISEEDTDKRCAQMLGRIGMMIPEEFFETDYSTVEDAVGLLLERYYSEMATKFYNENQKQLKRNRNNEQDTKNESRLLPTLQQ